MRTHTGEQPYQCSECDINLSNKNYFIDHMRTHTGEQPYHCYQCDMTFSHYDNLIIHIRTHTRDKLYNCNQCDMSFSNNSNLIRYMITHTEKKPFHCISHLETHNGGNLFNVNIVTSLSFRVVIFLLTSKHTKRQTISMHLL